MAKRVSRFEIGNCMVGRILSFDRLKGYGFIRTATNEDILFSSFDIPKNSWKRMSIGDYVHFTVDKSEKTNNHVVATGTTIIKKMPKHLSITLPNHEKLEIRHIYQYGKGTLLKDGYGTIYPSYPAKSFDYVFFKTPRRSFTFNCYDSPVVIDGEVDTDEYYLYLTDILTKYDFDRDYASF